MCIRFAAGSVYMRSCFWPRFGLAGWASRAGVRGARKDLRRDACGHRADGRRCRHEIGAPICAGQPEGQGGRSRGSLYSSLAELTTSLWSRSGKNRQALEAHEAAAHTKKFREQIDPLLGSPYDERLHTIGE